MLRLGPADGRLRLRREHLDALRRAALRGEVQQRLAAGCRLARAERHAQHLKRRMGGAPFDLLTF